MNIHILLARLMFAGLFPIAFFWLRKGWRIGFKKDYSAVVPGKEASAGKHAALTAFINLAAGAVLASVIILVIIAGLDYETWTAAAGITIWMKFFAEFIIRKHAGIKWKR